MDISVVLPALNEGPNLRRLLPRIRQVCQQMALSHEILVIDGPSHDDTREIAISLGARVLREKRPGFAGALETGIQEALGDYVLTLDADMSHDPEFLRTMWQFREYDIVVASRYVPGGIVHTNWGRNFLSRVLNVLMRNVLSMPTKDMSSGYRLYRREALGGITLKSRNFEVQEEILVKSYAGGFTVKEVPFTYFPRAAGRSHARLFEFGVDFIRSVIDLRKIRNSVDYEERVLHRKMVIRELRGRRRRGKD